MVTASARKKLPVTPVMATRGRKTLTGVNRGVEEWHQQLAQGSLDGLLLALAKLVPMTHNIFHHNNRVVDDKTHGRSHTAKSHEIKAFAKQVHDDERDGDGDRNDKTGDERTAPVTQEEDEHQ